MKVDHAYERPLAVAHAAARAARPSSPGAAVTLPAPAPQPASEVDGPALDAAVEAANRSMRSVATNLRFEKDTVSGRIIVRVIDGETQQVLHQMPSDEMLAMSRALDRLQGLMVHLKA